MNHIKEAYITEYSVGHSLTVALQDAVGNVNLSRQSISLHNLSADDYKRLHEAVIAGAKAAGVSLGAGTKGHSYTDGYTNGYAVGLQCGHEIGKDEAYERGQADAYAKANELVEQMRVQLIGGLHAND